MRNLIGTNEEVCTGCNRCVRECPMEMSNITYQDESGNIKVKIDHTKCIACGRCVQACKHDARFYEDDTSRFFADLAAGTPISLMTAPAICANIPEYKKVFTWLRSLGVNKIYDASLGADLCIWGHIRYIQKNGPSPMITQPCPVVVTYCEKYRHDLLDKLSPVQSPLGSLAVYMKNYEGIHDRLAAITPCIAKANEFDDTGLTDYNITFTKLRAYMEENDIRLPEEESDFDHDRSGLGSLFPMPGGLKENIEFYLGKDIRIDKAEGYELYERLNTFGDTPAELLPGIFDVLNCQDGCNIGSAIADPVNIFEIGQTMDKRRKSALDKRKKEYFDELYRKFDERFDLADFIREYKPIDTEFPDITEEDIQKAYVELEKDDEAKQNIDCSACGNDTCYDMARRIAMGVNIPVNCMVRTMDTAKREHENNLNALEELSTIWGHVESAIAIIDEKTRIILDVNPAAVRLFGAASSTMIGKECYAFFGQHECPITDLNQALDRAERMFTKSDGTVIPVLKSVSRIVYNGRRALLESFTDISSFKVAEEKSRMLEVAEQANKAKSAFLANMSHEIRTPMNAILGIAEIQLQDDNLKPDLKEALGKIHSSGDLLLGIINDILDLSKIEAGKLELVIDEYDTASLINDTVQLNMMRIGSKPIEFRLAVDEFTPANMIGDELRIKQILNNLLSNAFKYTMEGTVKLSITVDPGDKETKDVFLVLSVSDTGQGMTEEQVAKLFDEYTRFNMEANRTTEGTGLGMSITNNLIRLMEGEIYVESEPGKGSTFTVRLPQDCVGDDALGKELAENLQSFHESGRAQMKRVQISREPMPYGSVLIVDDVETNIYVATGLLAPYGLQVDSAISGYEAIDKIKDGNVYDIIFMDHMMPKMDGIEATNIIREMGYASPIVALTANAVVGQSEIFLENGFDDFISKPIDIRQMNVVLNKLIRDKQPPEVLEAARKQATESGAQEAGAQVAGSTGSEAPEGGGRKPAIDPRFVEVFVRDARKALELLEGIQAKGSYDDEEDVKIYIINTHGMKSALANIGMQELSALGLKLEQAGRELNVSVMEADTPGFIASLRELIREMEPAGEEEEGDAAVMMEEDKAILLEKLAAMIEACEAYNKKAANGFVSELREKPWPKPVKDLLAALAEYLLHSDFDEAAEKAEEYLKELRS
ncbi:MAG: ATP-binding protein [Clostridiales bacterium]|nr:ATP-binding protein [Clostridiales bacterium]